MIHLLSLFLFYFFFIKRLLVDGPQSFMQLQDEDQRQVAVGPPLISWSNGNGDCVKRTVPVEGGNVTETKTDCENMDSEVKGGVCVREERGG